jgi:DNA-binding NtrC family response regulator
MQPTDETTAVLLPAYRFGFALGEFRWAIEQYYVEPFEDYSWRVSFPSVAWLEPDRQARTLGEAFTNNVNTLLETGQRFELEASLSDHYLRHVRDSYGQICDTLDQLCRSVPASSSCVGEIRGLIQTMFTGASSIRGRDDYLCRLRAAKVLEMENHETRTYEIARILIETSPFGPEAWRAIDAQVATFATSFSRPGTMLELGRALSSIHKLFPSSFDPATNQFPNHDPIWLSNEMSPRVRTLLERARPWVPSLRKVKEWIEPSEHQVAAARIHDEILSAFAEPTPSTTKASSESAPFVENEFTDQADIPRLLALKETIDPENQYIAKSLPILRLFEQIQKFNQTPGQPLVILGPSVARKTELAKLIHRHSGRPGKFRSVSASEFKNSALGLLRENDKGTILVKELFSMDAATADLLRDCIDGKPMTPAAGDGEPFAADVRFIFSTYKALDEVKDKVPEDFFELINSNILRVPSLQQCREDIPFFVEKHRGDLSVEPEFCLALMRHDWARSEVGHLIKDLEASVRAAKLRRSKTLKLQDLPRSQFHEDIKQIEELGKDASRECYLLLISILEKQGFTFSRRDWGLNERLAKIFKVDPSTMSRRLKAVNIQPPAGLGPDARELGADGVAGLS